jgi:transcriptional regulator PpsR
VASRVLASAADLALILDREGFIQEVSLGEGIEAHRGWNELVGERWADTVTIECVPKAEQLVNDTLAGKVSRSREINQNAQGVGEVPFRVTAVLLDEQRVAVLGRDLRPISVLQQRMVGTQQAMDREFTRLREADTRYRVLFHVASEGAIVATVENLRITEANPAAASLLDKPAQALQGLSVYDLFDKRSRRAVQALITSVEEGGRPKDVEVTLHDKPGKICISASLFRQAGTALILIRLSPLDAAGAAASAPGRTSQMMAVLDALPDGVVVTGQDRRILSANSAFCDLVENGNEKQVLGQSLERWLGRPGVDLNIIVANLREHSVVRNFATIIRGEFGASREALVTAVSAMDGKVPCLGFTIRPAPPRLALVPAPLPRSLDQLHELVGRVPLKDIVRESADLIERLCIKAALEVSGDNRASAAQLLGLSRQGLYAKLRRHGMGELDGQT